MKKIAPNETLIRPGPNTVGDQNDPPGNRQKRGSFADAEKRGRLRLIASKRDGSVVIHQDADIYAALLEHGDVVDFQLKSGRRSWVQIAHGGADIDGVLGKSGDGFAIEGEPSTLIAAQEKSEIIVLDLP